MPTTCDVCGEREAIRPVTTNTGQREGFVCRQCGGD